VTDHTVKHAMTVAEMLFAFTWYIQFPGV